MRRASHSECYSNFIVPLWGPTVCTMQQVRPSKCVWLTATKCLQAQDVFHITVPYAFMLIFFKENGLFMLILHIYISSSGLNPWSTHLNVHKLNSLAWMKASQNLMKKFATLLPPLGSLSLLPSTFICRSQWIIVVASSKPIHIK